MRIPAGNHRPGKLLSKTSENMKILVWICRMLAFASHQNRPVARDARQSPSYLGITVNVVKIFLFFQKSSGLLMGS
jgi:hypothetical protein